MKPKTETESSFIDYYIRGIRHPVRPDGLTNEQFSYAVKTMSETGHAVWIDGECCLTRKGEKFWKKIREKIENSG